MSEWIDSLVDVDEKVTDGWTTSGWIARPINFW